MLLIGSPRCKWFSAFKNIYAAGMRPEELQKEITGAVKHMEFMVSLYREQMTHGRYFLHGHPRQADSWKRKCTFPGDDKL